MPRLASLSRRLRIKRAIRSSAVRRPRSTANCSARSFRSVQILAMFSIRSGALANNALRSSRLKLRYWTSVIASTEQCAIGPNSREGEMMSPGKRNNRICRLPASTVTLSDGSRQILLFLLPGDIISPSLLFGPMAHCSVEAITEVQYRSFRRDDLKALLARAPDLIENIAKIWTDRKLRAEQLAVDLGRRTADERIARLILSLRERLASRGMVQDQTMDFPLRQHHLAEATGLAACHISTVLSGCGRRG